MRSMRSLIMLQLTLVGIFVMACGAFAEVPRLINYQGTITGTNGPVDGSFDLTFRVYSDSLSGTALWTELHTRVNVNYGVFSIILGSVTTIPDGLLESPERWIGITVGSDPEVNPRMKITSVPWAFRAAKADTSLYAVSTKIVDGQVTAAGLVENAVTTSKIADANVTNAKLADSAVTSDKIAGEQVVKSINSLKDDVTLAAGANVTITPSGNTLTIAATGAGGGSGLQTANAAAIVVDDDWTWDDVQHYLYPTDTDPSVKVGIGTNSPLFPLHVVGNVAGNRNGVVHVRNDTQSGAGLYAEGWENAIRGEALNPDGCGNGVVGLSEGPGSSCGGSIGAGVAGLHGPETGGEGGIGVFAHNWNDNGFAFYGQGGKNYFENNVGIGTKNPLTRLHVNGRIQTDGAHNFYGKADAEPGIILENTGTFMGADVTDWMIFAGGGGGGTYINNLVFKPYQDIDPLYPEQGNILFLGKFLGANQWAHIKIGINAPWPNHALEVGGDIKATGGLLTGPIPGPCIGISPAESPAGTPDRLTTDSHIIYLDQENPVGSGTFGNDVNVGIMEPNPQQRLHITHAGGNPGIRLQNADTNGSTWELLSGTDGLIGTDGNGPASQGFTNRFGIRNVIDGRVPFTIAPAVDDPQWHHAGFWCGMGTADPKQRLHISYYGDDPGIRLENRHANTWDLVSGLAKFGGGANQFGIVDVTNNVVEFTITPGGKVGIGTLAPSSQLHIFGDDPDLTLDINSASTNAMVELRFKMDNVLKSRIYWSKTDSKLYFENNEVDRMVIDDDGNVGIGKMDPDARLTIKGGTVGDKTIILRGYDAGGNEIVTIGKGFDYSETFPTSQPEITSGIVMVIDPVNKGRLAVSSQAYDKKVAGIVAGANGLGSGVRLGSSSKDSGEQAVALAGRVYCSVDTKYGDIQPGDLLTTSPTPGHAMVVKDFSRAQGAILGKAMEGLSGGGKGQILVLVTLQ